MSNDQQRRQKHGDRPSADDLSWEGAPAAGPAPQAQLQAAAPSDDSHLTKRLLEMSGIIRADSRWDGNEQVFAAKEESDVAMLDDILTDALRLTRQQATTAAIPEGWKLVPLELTPKMRFDMSGECATHLGKLDKMYEAAIAAAPAHPAMPALLDHAHAEAVAWAITVGDDFANTFLITKDKAEAQGEYDRAILGGYESIYQLVPLYRAATPASEVSQGAAPTAEALRDQALEEAAQRCESAELLFDVDELMRGTKKELTAITATKLAEEIRALKRAAQPNIQEAGNAE